MGGYDIAFAPHLPLWALAAIGAVCVLLFGWTLLRGIPGGVLRGLLAAVLLLGLANPALLKEEREPNRDVALLIVDETPSQRNTGRLEETRAAADAMAEELARFSEMLEVRRVTLSHDSLEDGADGTRVTEAARAALADIPARRFAGAVIVTDGRIHDAAALADLPPGPVHALIAGAPDASDRRLVIEEAPGFGVVDEPLEMTLRVEDPDAPAGATVRPSLRVDGQVQRIDRIPFNRDVTISLTLERRGPSVVDIEVPVRDGELSELNNRAVLSINGVRDRLRVLLVSGQPHPGERTWRNLLKSDPSVDLVHFTILRPPEKQDGTPIDELSLIAFPTRELFEVKLNDFDLIVFDSYRRRGVLPSIYLNNIVEYVRRGGALLDAAGPGFASPFSLYRTPLGEILPLSPTGRMNEGRFIPAVTDLGLRHPVTAGLPGGPDRIPGADGPDWGDWLRQIDVSAKQGDVVMSGLQGQPLVALDRVGDGRVAQVSSDHIWLWARGYDGGGPHAELLRRLAHWLMQEPELEENDLTARPDGEQLSIRLRSLEPRGEAPTVSVVAPDGMERAVTLSRLRDGLFAGAVPLDQIGLYTVSEGGRTVRAAAGARNALELRDLVATDAVLRGPVESRGGRIHWLSDGPPPSVRHVDAGRRTGGSGWIGLHANGDFTVVGLDASPLLPGWLAMLLTALLLGGAWLRESR
jgi:hypothetical protein